MAPLDCAPAPYYSTTTTIHIPWIWGSATTNGMWIVERVVSVREYGSLDHHGHPLCPPTSWFAEHDVPREIAAPVAALARTARRPLVLHRNSGDRRARQAGALLASRRFA